MAYEAGRIGIDIGALFIKAVRIDPTGKLQAIFYEPHKGNPSKALESALWAIKATEHDSYGITGSAADLFADMLGVIKLDLTRCQIKAINRKLAGIQNIIDIGGGSATLIQLDRNGKFNGYATNSLCAAGTGSFLDEQANRLGISYADMQHFEHVDHPPTIATRCSVFAKSDLIHRQQEGYSKAAMWSGLCKGMTRTLLSSLLLGKPLHGPTAIIGGVAKNREVIRWLRFSYPDIIQITEHPHLIAAWGAAISAEPVVKPIPRSLTANQKIYEDSDSYAWKLTLEKSIYPSFKAHEEYTDKDDNEIRIIIPLRPPILRATLGIDIGSTSTKLALVDENEQVVLDIYRKTGGEPIQATKLLLRALRNLQKEKGIELEILGAGTTGSGRKMVGKVIGADAIVNEISAHVAGAVKTDPTIDTIFEIGGQDSKYMHVVNQHIRDTNMNYVCAAGTGSFVEEQALKLGYPVHKVGPAILGLRPPRTSDRCTVFMEQDVAKLVQSRTTPEQALAGVMVSVVKNYLNKVVGNRYRSKSKIFFQGATARNPALVAAFEKLLNVKMVVSPNCHVMGAYGVALLTRQVCQKQGLLKSAFRGLNLEDRTIGIRKETCALCQNNCQISYAEIEGMKDTPSWGYMCGRDPEEDRVRVNPHDKPLRTRQRLWREGGKGIVVADSAPVVGIPQSLTTYTYLPLWRRFFNSLGLNVVLSGTTTDEIRSIGTKICGAEFCFPAKIAMGHAATLATKEGVDYVFLPHMISEKPSRSKTAAKFCPYVQGSPSFTRTALEINGIDTSRVLSPVIDLRLNEIQISHSLAKIFEPSLGMDAKVLQFAWREALTAQRQFEQRCREEGRKILDRATQRKEKLILLAGRPYNNYDTGINLGLPQKLAEHGRTIIPIDFLSTNTKILGKQYHNIYWNYGRKILSGIKKAAQSNVLDVVYLTNFNCGPDSFLLSYAEEIMRDKPFLALEMDEHGADAGYLTRIEAFFDVLERPRSESSKDRKHRRQPKNLKNHTIWIPPMHPLGTAFFAAAFRRHGYDARPLPAENQDAFDLGRSLTRGSECLPTALTIGSFLQTIKKQDGSMKHALFMPTAEGPCRFGQYCTLHRIILDNAGLDNTAILSPSSFNSYQGVAESVRRDLWKSLLIGDVLFKAVCKVRPYELNYGQTDRILKKLVTEFVDAFADGKNPLPMLQESIARLAAIERNDQPKPLVGIVGEIYVRCNPFANEDVVRCIENFGGEAWLTPMSEWILYTAATQTLAFRDQSRNILKKWISELKNRFLFSQEHKFYQSAGSFLNDRQEPPVMDVIAMGNRFVPVQFEGEAILTVGRAMAFAQQGAALVVNCAPFGCMPGTLTTALFQKLAPELKIPIVNLFYDGSGKQNRRLEVFLNNAVKKTSLSEKEIQTADEITQVRRLASR